MIAFERPLAPPRWLAPLRSAMAAMAACGAFLAVMQADARWGRIAAAAVAVACVGLVLAGWIGSRPPVEVPILRVDAQGRARLRIGPREYDCVPRRWLLADGWLALSLQLCRPGGGTARRLELLSGARPHDDSWRCLRVWLAWLRRGSLPDGEFGEADAARGTPRGR